MARGSWAAFRAYVKIQTEPKASGNGCSAQAKDTSEGLVNRIIWIIRSRFTRRQAYTQKISREHLSFIGPDAVKSK